MHTHNSRKGTHLCACQKASYTLEAAVILPFLVCFFAFLLFFFRVLQIQTGVQTALYYASRKTACEAGSVDSAPVLFALAEGHFRKELKRMDVAEGYLPGGSLSISLLGSDFSGEYVELRADYFVKSPINIWKTRGIYITQRSKSRKWTGDEQAERTETYVYVAEYGTVYHCSRECHYLDLSIRPAEATALSSLRNKSGRSYRSCEICVEGAVSGTVYITDYGDCYHDSLSCSGLKRTVYLVPLSEVGGKGPCSKCGKGKNN